MTWSPTLPWGTESGAQLQFLGGLVVLFQLQHSDVARIHTCALRVLLAPVTGVAPKRHDVILIKSFNPVALAYSHHMHAWNAINLWDTTSTGSKMGTIIIGDHWDVACVYIGRNNTVDVATPHVPLLTHSNLKVTKIDIMKGTNQQFLSIWGQNIRTAPGIVTMSIIPFALQVKEKYYGINRINSRPVPDT
jgi:hypothetical protein